MTASPWRRHTLVLVDLQRDFWSAVVAATAPELPDRVAALLAYARAEGLTVVHVRARFRPDGRDWMARYRLRGWVPRVDGTPGVETLSFAAEASGEPVVTKRSFDGSLAPTLTRSCPGAASGACWSLGWSRPLVSCSPPRRRPSADIWSRLCRTVVRTARSCTTRRWRRTRSCSTRCALTRSLNGETGGKPKSIGWTTWRRHHRVDGSA